jgi:hypothetical protein
VFLDYGLKLYEYIPLAAGLVRFSLVIWEATQFHFSVAVTPGTETILSSCCTSKLTVPSFQVF